MLITEIELKKCWEYLEFETRYFTPVEKYLTQQIDFKNTGSVNFDKQFFSELKKAKKAGLDKIERVVYDKADTIEKVPNLYKYKLEQFKKRSKSLIELDFCDIELNRCDIILSELLPRYQKYFGPFDDKINQQLEEITLLLKIIKAYRLHIQLTINQSSENKNRYDHITKLRHSNRIISNTEFGNINSNIQSFIRKEFKYFEEKHNSTFYKTLNQVYYKDAESIYRIAQTSIDKVKQASIELSLLRTEIDCYLNDIERFLVYLKSDYPEDCLKLIQSIEAIHVNYKAILSGNGVKIENTYNYEFFKNRFELWEEKYRTSLLTTKSLGQQTEMKTEQETIEMKPVFKPEAIQMVFDILKDFFSPEQQVELKQIIETGNKANKKMLFKGNGNRLSDTFKKLIEHDFIIGCQKQDLINWIISNFTFTHQGKVKVFVYDTVEKTISRKYYPCKSPLIEIKNGQIQRVEQPRTKRYN